MKSRIDPCCAGSKVLRVCISILIVLSAILITPCMRASEWVLWYEKPAEKWVQALPIGNGRLGAMVFGGVEEERIQLNEDTLWAGSPVDRDREGAYEHLDEARGLLFEGKYLEAQRIMQSEFMGPRLIRSYQTLGDIEFEFDHGGTVEDYRRELDLDSALAKVTYTVEETTYEREVFSSPVDQAIYVHLAAHGDKALNFKVRLTRPADAKATVEGNTIVLRGRAVQGEEHSGVRFESRLKVSIDGGELRADDDAISVSAADSAV
ncbi:MAG: glycoside hydrolase family 95 protein, partial [Verrucomicrobia bacterium]|nr:glycoside hydrolase family 95 protein [Verrucomicrobiota bacterium]